MEQQRLGRWVAVAVALASCGGHGKNAPLPQTPADGFTEDALVADIMQHHRFHHHGGVLMLLTMSLDALGLPEDEQVQVERIQADLLAKLRPAAQAERELMELLADGVAVNQIDRAEVDAVLARVASTTEAARQAATDDLDRLHATLRPEQRSALMDRLQAHWALWKQANQGDGIQLSVLGKQLALSSDQIAKAGPELAKADVAVPLPEVAVDHQLEGFSSAFRSDGFDARRWTAGTVDRDLTAAGTMRLVRFCEALDGVLNEEQRWNLARILREHGSHDDTQPSETL